MDVFLSEQDLGEGGWGPSAPNPFYEEPLSLPRGHPTSHVSLCQLLVPSVGHLWMALHGGPLRAGS